MQNKTINSILCVVSIILSLLLGGRFVAKKE